MTQSAFAPGAQAFLFGLNSFGKAHRRMILFCGAFAEVASGSSERKGAVQPGTFRGKL